MKRVPKHRRWQKDEAKLSNYVGLTEEEKVWLQAFNNREIDDDFSQSDVDQELKRSYYRRSYRQRYDAQNIAVQGNPNQGGTLNPLDGIIGIIDATSRNRAARTYRKFRLLINPNFLPIEESKDGCSTVDREPIESKPKRRA